MDRRDFNLRLAAAAAAVATTSCARQPLAAPDADGWRSLEALSGGRLGGALLHADGRIEGHRLDERFPMCSTFKWLLAACVLQRVQQGQERLDRRIVFGRDVLLPHSPVTQQHVDAGMTVAELCHATVTTSDNAAANLLLATVGGPAGLTAYARSLGDQQTRLDRWEPALNEALPGDPRDTTTPRAMARLLHAALLGPSLHEDQRRRLAGWLEATRTNGQRLRADLPAGWRMGSKTGGGPRGTSNDVGIFWPPGHPPVIAVAFVTGSQAPDAERNQAIAGVARRVVATVR